MKVLFRKGDTFWYYSQLFRLPLVLIEESNKEHAAQSVEVGAEVAIPGYTIAKYEVLPGDTLWSISMRKRVPLDSLYVLNQNKKNSNLKIGDIIQIPEKVTLRMIDVKKQYDSTVLFKDLQKLCQVYPFLECSSIGQSVLNKQLHHIKIGKGKRKIHWNGSFHANEWITSSVIMAFLNDYLLAITNNQPLRGIPLIPLFEQVTLSIVPMVNPDGVDLVVNGVSEQDSYKHSVVEINKGHSDFTGWKANIRGVDLNNQFPAKWEIEKNRKEPKVPAARDYPGERPLTEPEAIAMANLARQEDFSMVVAFHTQGEEFYWGYEGYEPNESASFAKEFERVSMYKSVQYVDSHAGYKDWFIQEFKRPGFTLELGRGINPLPLSQFDKIYQNVSGICLASIYMSS